MLLCFVLTMNSTSFFYPTTSVHLESVLIQPREIKIMWAQATVKQSKPNKQAQFIKVKQVKCS